MIRRSMTLLLFMSALVACAAERSRLYPTDWNPGFALPTGQRLQDYSYAGYRGGGVAIPRGNNRFPVIDVTKAPYNADATGASDAGKVIQEAIDSVEVRGGGVVYIPEGLYRIDGVLSVEASNIVIIGAGAKKTRLLFTNTGSKYSSLLLFKHPDFKQGDFLKLTADANTFDRVLQLENTEGLKVGDDIVVGFRMTKRFKAEHGMQKYWYMRKVGSWLERHWRTVTKVTPNSIEIDVPIRYPIKVVDGAAVRKVENMISECGIENLGISNAIKMDEAWKQTGLIVIGFRGVKDCWVSGVESFATPGQEPYHLQSKGIFVKESKRMTVANCRMENPQNRGGGGNGYLFELTRTDEVLVTDCVALNGRHNFSINSIMGAAGCVFRRVTSAGSKSFADYKHFQALLAGKKKEWSAYSDIHSGLTVAILVEDSTLDDGWDVRNRHGWSAGAGLTATEMVFWNNKGKGKIISYQYKTGYIIGTGKGLSVLTEERTNPKGFSGSAPVDYTESLGVMVEPRSLYGDQLKRRLGK